jgi:inorganic triphosphatase YgiF
MDELVERERKWVVGDGFEPPELDAVTDGGAVAHATLELTSVYFDTRDHDLQAHGLLLRRRDDDDDTGW